MQRLAFLLALILSLSTCAIAGEAPEASPKRVLLISTGSRLGAGFILIDQQILKALNTMPSGRIDVYAENLDIGRFPAARSRQIFREYLTAKYVDHPPDLVILVFIGKLDVPTKVLGDLFPNTPIIVAGYTEEDFGGRQFGPWVTGFAQRTNPQATLDVIVRLHPDLERLVVIGGTADVDRELTDRVRSAAGSLPRGIRVEYWDDRTISDIRRDVTQLPPRTAVLYARMFRDKAGQPLVSSEVGQWIGRHANAPVYVLVDPNIGTGAVGGMVSSAEATGQRVGELAVRILNGTSLSAVPFEARSDTVPMFDWRALKRWGIREDRLPPDSVVRYKPASLWENYRWHIGAVVIIVFLQSVTIIALAAQRRRRQVLDEALQENRQMMELATDAGELGLWTRDFATGRMWVNPALRTLFDFGEQNDVRFEDIVARVHPDDRARVLAEVEAADAAGSSFEFESRIRRRDGTERWALAKGRTVVDRDGRESRRMGAVLDITERKRSEERLRESENRFRTMADAAPVMIWMVDTDQLCTFCNNGWLRFTGRTLEQELGNGWTESVHVSDVERCFATYSDAFKARSEFTIAYRLRRYDAEYRHVLDYGVPRFDANGTFLGYIGTVTDVTDLKRAEESQESQRAFLRRVIDVTPTFIFAKDREGRFTLANRAVAKAYGVEVDDLIGKTDADFNPHAHEVESFRRIDLEVMDTLEERFIPEEPFTDASGKVRWLQTVKCPLIGPDGRADQVLGASTDITERKKTEMELREQHAVLAHVGRVSLMGELAASLAHELNQPLTAILSNAGAALRLMEQGIVDDAELKEILEDILAANNRAAEVIRQMRSLVKKDGEPAFSTVHLGDIVREVAALARTDAVMHDVRIVLDIEAQLPCVRGDRVQLQQVVLNLLLNAFDAIGQSRASGREVIVRVYRVDGATIGVSVIDRGPGLSGVELERIFEPFYTTKQEGLGMGLSICRTIIQAHGGNLSAENNAERGATFRFTVPAEPVDAPEIPRTDATLEASSRNQAFHTE